MGKVDCFAIHGLLLWFNSNDHLPPHFHAERVGEWGIVVRFLRPLAQMIERVWGELPTRKDRKVIVGLAAKHRVDLLAEWEMKTGPKGPGLEE